MPEKVSKEDLELLDELGVDTAPREQSARTPREQRIIAGYEEIVRFVEQHGRLPEHGENQDNGEVRKGDFFIVEGQKAYIADWGEPFISSYNKPDRRLRVIYDNGTESDLLLRSMQRALNRDAASRRVTDPTLGPLFSNQEEDDDQAVGGVYVLRSKSDNPFITENRKVIHKIGITKGSVKQRVANAAKDPTYLLADVEIVETYKISNLDLNRLEKLLHRFFDPARLDLQLKDRFGFDVEPREWFLVPLPIIEEAIRKLIDGTLPKYRYEPKEGRIVADK